MSDGSITWSFTYDADGMRTKRTNGSTTYNYVYNGSQLSHMSVGSNNLYFLYDASGTPVAVIYNGTLYRYVTNLQGDVVKIRNASGTDVVTYTYDAWGRLLSTTGSLASTLGTHNPLRYRGYVYDQETGLYYLQSRYYNPALCSFLNADALASTGQGVQGNNMFAYCDNNSINLVDYLGEYGRKFELGGGWYYRIDPQNDSTGTKRHIHIWKNKKEYIQNEDGSTHDDHKGTKGKIPDWLNDILIDKIGWDYNGKRNSFFKETSVECWSDGVQYTFADGRTVFRPYSPYMRPTFSVDAYESVYSKSEAEYENVVETTTIYIPIIGPVNIPSFSFGFSWGSLPIPFPY